MRLLSETMDDLDVVTYHEVGEGGARRRVSCLEMGCPLCRVGKRDTPIGARRVAVFFPLIDQRDGVVKIWERSMWSVEKEIKMVLERCQKPLCGQKIEVVRRGAKGNIQTSYQLFAERPDDMTLKSLPERPALFGDDGVISEMNAAEMEEIIEGLMTPATLGADRVEARGADVF